MLARGRLRHAMNMPRVLLRTRVVALAAFLSACSAQQSLPYPATWPALDAAAKHDRCGVIDATFSDRGSAAPGNEVEIGVGTQSVSLSGLLITGNEQASAYAQQVHVISATSCDARVDLLDPSDRSVPTHLVQAGTDAPAGFAANQNSRSTADASALSTRNVRFKFLEATDGSLVVQETIRHADVEDLIIPTQEILVLWFRFPKTAGTVG